MVVGVQNSDSMVKEKKILSERSIQNLRIKILEIPKPLKTKLQPRKPPQKLSEVHRLKEHHKDEEEGEDSDDVEHFNAELDSERIVFSTDVEFIINDETLKYPPLEIRDTLTSTATLPRGSMNMDDIECISEASDSASPSKDRQSPGRKNSPIVSQLEKKVKEQVTNTRRNQLDRYYNENTFLGCGRVSLESIKFD